MKLPFWKIVLGSFKLHDKSSFAGWARSYCLWLSLATNGFIFTCLILHCFWFEFFLTGLVLTYFGLVTSNGFFLLVCHFISFWLQFWSSLTSSGSQERSRWRVGSSGSGEARATRSGKLGGNNCYKYECKYISDYEYKYNVCQTADNNSGSHCMTDKEISPLLNIIIACLQTIWWGEISICASVAHKYTCKVELVENAAWGKLSAAWWWALLEAPQETGPVHQLHDCSIARDFWTLSFVFAVTLCCTDSIWKGWKMRFRFLQQRSTLHSPHWRFSSHDYRGIFRALLLPHPPLCPFDSVPINARLRA